MYNSPYMQNSMTMSPSYSPMTSPYQSRLDAMQQTMPMQRMEIIRVNGRNGAETFRMPPNSQALLLDESAPIVWLKQTDGAGYATATPYSIAPYQEASAPDYNSLDKRIRKLEAILSGKPYDSTDDESTAASADTK